MPRCPLRAVLLGIGLALVAPGGAAAQTPARDCSIPGQNAFVHAALQQYYLWYRELPVVDPARFTSPEALLDAVRYRTFDASFSFIAGQAADAAYYGESQYAGFGFSSQLTGPNELRIAQVFPASPAADVGMSRGDLIVAVNGRDLGDLLQSGEIGSIFGGAEPGVTAQIRFRGQDGRESTALLTKRVVTIPPVALTETHTVGGRRVGYIFFRNFVQPSVAALDSAFARLAEDGATELVLDLRYNGGGLVSVAQHLAGLIGGEPVAGQVFTHFAHNDKNTERDEILRFPTARGPLRFSRLVVITTRASASASELIINGLRPFMAVTVIGDNTYGKPVGQYGFDFCEKVLYPVAFATKNAFGEGDYFGGLPADCRAPDDLLHQIGDPAEASLATALGFIERGTCSTAAASTARAQALRRPALPDGPHRESGWQQLVGAY